MNGGKNKIQNRLWLVRRRRGLEQKQVAYLLNHRTIDQVSRYENGSRLPTLQVALKLEVIFGVPIRLLFLDLHKQVRSEIKERAETSQSLKNALTDLFSDGLCSYAELLDLPQSSEDIQRVSDHARKLVNRITELRQHI